MRSEGVVMDIKKKTAVSYMLYFIIFITASIPVACNYIMSGGLVWQWIMRVEEMAAGLPSLQYLLFPSNEVVIASAGQANAFNSSFWFILPAVIYRLGGSMAGAYQVYMLLLQLGSLTAAVLMFKRLFGNGTAVMFGVLLYMTFPYRIYVCYDLADMGQAAAWMLLPLYIWGLLGIAEQKKRIKSMVIAAAALAGIGYAGSVFFLVAAGCTVLAAIFEKKISLLIPVAAGAVLGMPGLLPLIKYLFINGREELGMPLQSIMEKGYSASNFFSSFAYREGRPGMGLALFIGILTLIWLYFVKGSMKLPKRAVFAAALSVLFLICSMKGFPWDILQRLGTWALRLIPLFGSPALFFGFACFGACIPAAYAVEEISVHKNKAAAIGLPVIIFTAALGICVYMCNYLTFSRLPVEY